MPTSNAPSQNQPAQQVSTLTTMKIIWGALFASVGVYAVVAQFLVAPADGARADLLLPLGAAAFGSAAMGFLLPNLLLKKILQDLPPDADQERILRASFTSFVIRLALFESVALYGLVMSFLGSKSQSYFFFIAAAILFLTSARSSFRTQRP